MKPNQNASPNRQGRPNQNNNNQKRQNKGRVNQPRNQQPRNQQANSSTKQMESRGPGGSLRGNAKQLYEKYSSLAQERRASDRLESESLAQHADHYYRIYAETAATEAAAQVARDAERIQRERAEAERRANSAPVNEARKQHSPAADHEPVRRDGVKTPDAPEKPKTARAKPHKTEPVSASPAEAAQQKPVQDAAPLILDLGGPVAEEPKKRRGRPAKVKPEGNAEPLAPAASGDESAGEVPIKKIVRKPRKKIIVAPDQDGAEEKSAE